MNGIEMFALAGYAIVAVAGFVLGTIFGQRLASDVQSILRALESRVASVEGSVSATTAAASTSAVVTSAAAIEHHAAATTQLAAAVAQHVASTTAPVAPAPVATAPVATAMNAATLAALQAELTARRASDHAKQTNPAAQTAASAKS